MRRYAALALVAACAVRPAEPLEPAFREPVHRIAVHRPEHAPDFRLPRDFMPTRYRADLDLDALSFRGRIEIDGDLNTSTSIIWLYALDLHVISATAKQGAIERALVATLLGDRLALQAEQPLPAGRWTVVLSYSGAIRPQISPICADYNVCDYDATMGALREGEYIFTNFEPMGARRVFPCFDEPDVKVPWQLALTVAGDAIATGNAPIAHVSYAAGRKRVEFLPTAPLPSYLVAFAVGPFDVIEARKTKHGVPIRILVPRGIPGDVAAIARATPAIVEQVEDYTGVDFPYPKLDVVGVRINGGNWGAMENAGLITIGTSWLAGTQAYRPIVTHEIAHQWFGDLVTLAWWNDAWLNEGFASWMAAKLADGWIDWQQQHNWMGPHAVRATMGATHRAEDIVTYLDGSRGGALIRMFESFVGDDAFRRAIHAYLVDHANGSVTSLDLIRAVNAASGQTLDAAFTDALDRLDTPTIEISRHCRSLTITPETPAWTVPVCITYDRDGARGRACTLLAREVAHLELAAKRCPRWMIPNTDDAFVYEDDFRDDDAASWILEALPILTPRERKRALSTVGSLSDPVGRIALVPKILALHDDTLIDSALWMLIPDIRLVPTDLVPQLVKRVAALGPVRPRLYPGPGAAPHESTVALILALLGDTQLVEQAARATDRDPIVQYPLGSILALHQPELLEKRLDKAPDYERRLLLFELGHTPTIIDRLESGDLAKSLSPDEVAVLLSGTCDIARRDRALAIAASFHADAAAVRKNIDTCISRRAKLDPIFRSWLGKP